jgi:uncharacterized protein involved in type VI secretion and phage assembly
MDGQIEHNGLAQARYSQQDHLLRIDTILSNDPAEQQFEGDPLLLAKLDGDEGISRLFAYDVIMLRFAEGKGGKSVKAAKRPPIDTRKLIGTRVAIGARPGAPLDEVRPPGEGRKEHEYDTIFTRVGMFETFEEILETDVLKRARLIRTREYYVYGARLVPWVKVLTRDICYRVFENKTVYEIIDAITVEANKTFPELIVDASDLKDHPFPQMEYCVQYEESTFAFLSRLMRRFGIWYYFGHRKDKVSNGGQDNQPKNVLNETMILKINAGLDTVRFTNVECRQESDPGHRDIAKLVRRYRPPERRVALGGFNYISPTNPFYEDNTVAKRDDLLRAEGPPATDTRFFGTTRFAEPVFSQSDANDLAKAAGSDNQSEVMLISGVSKNQTFAAGHRFHIDKPEDYDPKEDAGDKPYEKIVDRDYVIDLLKITATELTYLHPLFDRWASSNLNPEDATDGSSNALYKASLWATKTAQAMIYDTVDPLYGHSRDTAGGRGVDVGEKVDTAIEVAAKVTELAPEFFELMGKAADQAGNEAAAKVADDAKDVIGKITPFLGPFFGLLTKISLAKWAGRQKNTSNFAVGVIAVPADPPFDPPLPPAGRPVARGPHTAVVIGPDGVETREHDIYADAIGRVRIRFPWDPGPPEGGSKLPPVFPVTRPDKPTQVGSNTCWVRVVEGWAGRHYGTQFLPRIGQEVIVDFLDGDPERPVIVGRLYNADRGSTNLPFPDPAVKDTQIHTLNDLPATAKFDLPLSGIKTMSVPTTDSNGVPLKPRFHLLRFSDKREHEQFLIRSQRRLDITALQTRYESIGADRHLTVGGKDPDAEPPQIGGDYIAHVFGDYHLHVGDPEFYKQSGNRYALIETDDQLKVMGNVDQSVNGDWSTFTGGKATLQASALGGRIVLFAGGNITLTVGASSIVITPAGISITAPTINLVAPAIVSTVPVVPVGAVSLPPELPRNAVPQAPKDAIPADPGNSLSPPE